MLVMKGETIMTNETLFKSHEKQSNIHVIETTEKKDKVSLAYRFIKRCFDFTASLIIGVFLIIPIFLIAIIISIKDNGTPFYKQKRIGKDHSSLYIYKFRSMKKGADNIESMLSPEQLEEYKREYKLYDDPRLIGYKKPGDGKKCFGGIIRSLSIDELPQIFFNICILGNMSVVGPRPILESELNDNYTLDEQELLLSVKPGLTGYWQAYARNDVGYEEHKRQDMELYYVNNQSLWLDLKILFKTVGSVIMRKGAR